MAPGAPRDAFSQVREEWRAERTAEEGASVGLTIRRRCWERECEVNVEPSGSGGSGLDAQQGGAAGRESVSGLHIEPSGSGGFGRRFRWVNNTATLLGERVCVRSPHRAERERTALFVRSTTKRRCWERESVRPPHKAEWERRIRAEISLDRPTARRRCRKRVCVPTRRAQWERRV